MKVTCCKNSNPKQIVSRNISLSYKYKTGLKLSRRPFHTFSALDIKVINSLGNKIRISVQLDHDNSISRLIARRSKKCT